MRYPRPHEPILPWPLRPLVLGQCTSWLPEVSGDETPLALALGADAWTDLPHDTCRRMGRLVVRLVEGRLSALSTGAHNIALVAPARMLDLQLEVRTVNTLRRAVNAGVFHDGWTVGGYLAIPRFGARALVDVLAAAEAAGFMQARDDAAMGAMLAIPNGGSEATLDRLLVAIVRRLPISEKQARVVLMAEGLLVQDLDVDKLVRTAVRLGRKVPFRVIQLGNTRVVVRLSEVTIAKTAYRIAARDAHQLGVAWAPAIIRRLRALGHNRIDPLFVERLLGSVDPPQ